MWTFSTAHEHGLTGRSNGTGAAIFGEWGEVVHAKAAILNLDLEREGREPLPDREILHLARSISKWVWSRFTPEAFSEIQAQRVSKRWDKELKELALKRLNETISRAEEGRL